MPSKNFNSLVNRDFLFEKLKNNALNEIYHKKTVKHHPFITISREPGSGGNIIAQMVAEHLKYKFFDKNLIKSINREYEELYDEKELGAIQEFTQNLLYPHLLTQDKFVEKLIDTIISITLKGKCVILGRGANFFTDHKFGFHVRITAPFAFRVEKTVRYEHLSPKIAKERVETVSRERRKFVEKYFSKHIDNSEFYDLVLNREYYSLGECVAIIINAFNKKMKF